MLSKMISYSPRLSGPPLANDAFGALQSQLAKAEPLLAEPSPESPTLNVMGSVEQALRQSIQANSADGVFRVYNALSKTLCGQAWPANQMDRGGMTEFVRYAREGDASYVFYMADGGISRLSSGFRSDGSFYMEPTFNSSKTVKANFEKLMKL